MRYKDIKLVEKEVPSDDKLNNLPYRDDGKPAPPEAAVLGGTPVGRICYGLKRSARPTVSWRNKSMMIKSAEEFMKMYPQHEAAIRACMTKYGLEGTSDTNGSSDKGKKGPGKNQGNKGDGPGSSDKGDGTGSSDKGDGTGTGDKDGKGKIPGFTPPTGGKVDGTDKGTGDKPGDGTGNKKPGSGSSDLDNDIKEFEKAIENGEFKKAQEMLDSNPELNKTIDQQSKDDLNKVLTPPVEKPKKTDDKKDDQDDFDKDEKDDFDKDEKDDEFPNQVVVPNLPDNKKPDNTSDDEAKKKAEEAAEAQRKADALAKEEAEAKAAADKAKKEADEKAAREAKEKADRLKQERIQRQKEADELRKAEEAQAEADALAKKKAEEEAAAAKAEADRLEQQRLDQIEKERKEKEKPGDDTDSAPNVIQLPDFS